MIFDRPVDLEPPFARCSFPSFRSDLDDGRRPSLVRRLFLGTKRSEAAENTHEPSDVVRESTPVTRATLRIAVPPDCSLSRLVGERLLTVVGQPSAPISFEYVGTDHRVRYQVTLAETDLEHFEQAIRALAPEASILSTPDALAGAAVEPMNWFVADFGLGHECMLPLNLPAGFDPHPLAGVIAALANIREHETAVYQVLARPVTAPWASAMLHAAKGPSGDGLFQDLPEIVSRCREKIAVPLFSVALRVGAIAKDPERPRAIVRALAGSLGHLSAPTLNALVALTNDDYPDDAHAWDLLARRSRRPGMILNARELACLVHLPDATVRLEELDRFIRHTRSAPARLRQLEGIALGTNVHRGRSTLVRLNEEEQSRHLHVLGSTGEGKSTFLANLMLQHLEAGHGLALVDPHGGLVSEVLSRLPASRNSDVIYLDPGEARGCVPMNVLAATTDGERQVLAADLSSILRRHVQSWGDQIEGLLAASLSALLESVENATLIDLRRVLVDVAFRADVLRRVTDPETLFYWDNIFPRTGTRSVAPLLTRLDTFLRAKPVRSIVAKRSKSIDMKELLQGGVLLARLAQGSIGEANAYILGGLLTARIAQAALARSEVREVAHPLFVLCLDEAHALSTASLAGILSGGRKFGLGAVLCHQEWEQWRQSPEIASALLANAHTRVFFRLGETDAKRFATSFGGFSASDFLDLRIGEAIARVGDASSSFSLSISRLPELDAPRAVERREEVIRLSAGRFELDVVDSEKGPEAHPAIEKRLEASATARVPSAPVAPAQILKATSEPPSGGRGGRDHRYLQHLVARLGQERGFRASIEEQIPGGRIDVALYYGELRIACAVTLSSSPQYEAGGIERCLAAAYKPVLVMSRDAHHADAIRDALKGRITNDQENSVVFVPAEAIVEALDRLVPSETSSTVRGYKVKIRRMSSESAKPADGAVANIVARSLARNAKARK